MFRPWIKPKAGAWYAEACPHKVVTEEALVATVAALNLKATALFLSSTRGSDLPRAAVRGSLCW